METYHIVYKLFSSIITETLFICVLTIVISKWFIRNIKTELALSIIKWLLISQAILGLLGTVTPFIIGIENEFISFLNRATGPYWWAYVVMLFAAIPLPFMLLIKRFGKNIYFILLLTFLINAGLWFQRFVIILTSFHQDYFSGSEYYSINDLIPTQSIVLGVFWAILFLTIGNFNNQYWSKKEDVLDD